MDRRQKANYLSLVILLVCLLLTAVIYLYSGNIIFVILFAPAVIHWILKKRSEHSS